ncbi:MAG: M23 family metallopeptidase [Bacteroidota bacterium]
MIYRLFSLLIGIILLASCGVKDDGEARIRPSAPYDAYLFDLETAHLLDAALSRQWQARGEAVLTTDAAPSLPFEGVSYFAAERPTAVAYRLTLRRGEQLHIDVAPTLDGRLFLDLFRIPADTTLPLVRVLGSDSTFTHTLDIRRDDTYIVRLQPEVLASGQVRARLWTGPSLAFPVADHDSGDILSFFGAARDGGRRRHHGVDVFAPRGTPVVAVANGPITRVEDTNLGGKVVWQRDARRGLAIYYAHLDSQSVRPRQQVRIGDTLGTVGNTGNARTTPPHLHFGIYQRGPHDPLPFIDTDAPQPRPARVDAADLGIWHRTTASQTAVRAAPGRRAEVLASLPARTAVRSLGGTTGWLHIQLPDGRDGFVLRRSVQRAVPSFQIAQATSLVLRTPEASALSIGEVTPDTQALGFFDGYALVEASNGALGWVRRDA